MQMNQWVNVIKKNIIRNGDAFNKYWYRHVYKQGQNYAGFKG